MLKALASRWQIPAVVAGLAVSALALLLLRPAHYPAPYESILADVAALEQAGGDYEAAEGLLALLDQSDDLTNAQRAELHSLLAQAIFRCESRRKPPEPDNVRLMLREADQAMALGWPDSAAARLRAGQGYEWLENAESAVSQYQAALRQASQGAERIAALRALVPLEDQSSARAEYLSALVADDAAAAQDRWWGVRTLVSDALALDDVAGARAVLERLGERLKRSDLQACYDYLDALILVQDRRYEQAAPLVEWLAESAATGKAGFSAEFEPSVEALNLVLQGRIDLAQDRPQAGISGFDEVLARWVHPEATLAASLGKIQALARLERHDAAQALAREWVQRLRLDAELKKTFANRLATALSELAADPRNADGDKGISYLELALTCLDASDPQYVKLAQRVGRECCNAASVRSGDEARALFARGAQWLDRAVLAWGAQPEGRLALLWEAARAHGAAGNLDRDYELLSQFVEQAGNDARLPEALMELGRLSRLQARFDDAIGWFDRLRMTFPRLIDQTAQARLSTVECLLSMDAAAAREQAEEMLAGLLEDEGIGPDAPVYRHALLELCVLLYEQNRFGESIGRFRDFIELYPNDPDLVAAQFLVAQAYRRSAAALVRSDQPDVGGEALAEAQDRFRHAARLFDELGDALAAGRASLEPALVTLYQADCLYALSDRESLERAAELYRQVALRRQSDPMALTAQAQLANIAIRQGRFSEAGRSLDRGLTLLAALPEGQTDAGPELDKWRSVLQTVIDTHVFDGPLASAGAGGLEKP